MEKMEKTAQMTGTHDVHYNLISVVYHALQGAETCIQYKADAEESGDQELVGFFHEVLEQNRRYAERGKTLLAQRLNQGSHR